MVLSMAVASAGADTRRCRHCSTAMYCRASGESGGGAFADGPTGEGSSPSRLVIQAPDSSGRVPTDTPASNVEMAFTFCDSVNVEFVWCVQAAFCRVKTELEAAIIQSVFALFWRRMSLMPHICASANP